MVVAPQWRYSNANVIPYASTPHAIQTTPIIIAAIIGLSQHVEFTQHKHNEPDQTGKCHQVQYSP